MAPVINWSFFMQLNTHNEQKALQNLKEVIGFCQKHNSALYVPIHTKKELVFALKNFYIMRRKQDFQYMEFEYEGEVYNNSECKFYMIKSVGELEESENSLLKEIKSVINTNDLQQSMSNYTTYNNDGTPRSNSMNLFFNLFELPFYLSYKELKTIITLSVPIANKIWQYNRQSHMVDDIHCGKIPDEEGFERLCNIFSFIYHIKILYSNMGILEQVRTDK